MRAEFSTTPENSQVARDTQRPARFNFSLLWLILSALLWGSPIILFVYIPIAALESLLPKSLGFTNTLRQKLRNLKKGVFVFMVRVYLRLQSWFNPSFQLEELRKIETSSEKFLLIANHRSHLDVFLMLSQIRGVQVLAKQSLFRIPILGMMMRLTRQIPASRGSFASLEKARSIVHQRIQEGERVLIFPEFTRCEEAYPGIKAFSLLPFQIAMKEGVKIIPLVIVGTDKTWPKSRSLLSTNKHQQKVVALAPIDTKEFKSVIDLRDKVHSTMSAAFQTLENSLNRSSVS